MNAPMKRLSFLAAALLLSSLLLTPGCGPDEPAGVHVTPASFDFGRIRHGEVVTQSFAIKNNGDVPVTLAKARGNCSCISTSEPSRRRLEPGDEASIVVRISSGAVPAQRLRGKHLEILVHEPKSILLRVPLEGDIFAPATLTIPDGLDKLYFGRIGEPRSHDPQKLTVRSSPGFKIALDKSLQRYEAGFAFHPPQLAALFDVNLTAVKRGYDVSVALKQGATRPQDLIVRDPKLLYQLIGSITFQVREEGPGLKPRTVPHTVGLHGTWSQ